MSTQKRKNRGWDKESRRRIAAAQRIHAAAAGEFVQGEVPTAGEVAFYRSVRKVCSACSSPRIKWTDARTWECPDCGEGGHFGPVTSGS